MSSAQWLPIDLEYMQGGKMKKPKKMIQKKTEQNKKRTKQIERYTTEKKQWADGQNR